MEKISRIRRLKMIKYEKTLWYLGADNDWTYRNCRKTQHSNYYTLWYLFLYSRKSHSKCVILLGLCLFLAKNVFINFYSVLFKWMILLIMNITFLYSFSCYKTRIFLSKPIILIVLCLVLTNSLFSTIFTWWVKGKLFR